MPNSIDTYVINRASDTDHRVAVEAQLAALEVFYSFVEATDAVAVDQDELASTFTRSRGMVAEEKARALSHRRAWLAFLHGDGNVICVLEDKVQLAPQLAELLKDDGWVSPEHGIIKLDCAEEKRPLHLVRPAEPSFPFLFTGLFKVYSAIEGTMGYIAHRRTIETLLTASETFKVPLQAHLFAPGPAPLFDNPGVHVTVPPMVVSDEKIDPEDTGAGPLTPLIGSLLWLAPTNLIRVLSALVSGARYGKFD